MVIVSYPLALLLLIVIAVPVGGQISTPAVLWGLLSGVGQAFGVWWFYAALGSGPISVVSPLTAILVAGIPVGVGLALGERPGPVALVGVLLALAAVVLVSREATDDDTRSHKFTLKVAWLTVGSGVAFGMNFVILHQVPVEAELWPLVFGRLAAATIVLLAAAATANLVLERGCRCGWHCSPDCSTPSPTSRRWWHCNRRCCRWPASSSRSTRRRLFCWRSWCCVSE